MTLPPCITSHTALQCLAALATLSYHPIFLIIMDKIKGALNFQCPDDVVHQVSCMGDEEFITVNLAKMDNAYVNTKLAKYAYLARDVQLLLVNKNDRDVSLCLTLNPNLDAGTEQLISSQSFDDDTTFYSFSSASR